MPDGKKMKRNIKLLLTYDGSAFHGWQSQPDRRTVQDVLEDAVERLTGCRSGVCASGRTDAGVHAEGQVANFHTTSAIPLKAFKHGLNSLLPADMSVLDAEEVEYDFHAIGSCKEKEYEYRILYSSTRQPLWRKRAWRRAEHPDIAAMRRAAGHFTGTRDFSSVRASGCSARHSVRTITLCDIRREPVFSGYPADGFLIVVRIAANGFLRYMVRNITGLLVEVGAGRRSADDIPAILEARDRSVAGITAPAHGLYLKRVIY
jgi:tRNA pseudouridine38-40 synthase